MSSPTAAAPPSAEQKFTDAEAAAQKRFNIMAAGGLLVVLVLAFFVLTGGSDDEAAAAAAAAAAPAAAEAAPVPAADPAADPAAVAAPPPPGTSGGGGGGAGFSGGGGRPTSGVSTPRRPSAREAATTAFTHQRGVALGLSPRAAAALADSAAGRRSGSAAPTSGPATVGRATTLMSGPGTGAVLVTVPSGTRLSISGCAPAAGGTWCRASHAGLSGWVLQTDIGR